MALHPKYLLVVLIGLLRTIAMLVLIPTVVSMFKPEFFRKNLVDFGNYNSYFSILLVVFLVLDSKKKVCIRTRRALDTELLLQIQL